MSYKRERMKRTREEIKPSRNMLQESRDAPKRERGLKFTFLSFAIVGACMLVLKAVNPDISLTSPVMMFASVFLACIMMTMIARKMK